MGRYLLFLIGLALLGWTLATSLTQVQPGEIAVIRRFGRILPIRPEPGLYIGWPWGIEKIDRENVSSARFITVGFQDQDSTDAEVVPAGQILTGDHNLVNVQAKIEYGIREADVDRFVLQKENVDVLVARATETLLAEWIGGQKIDDIIRQGLIRLPAFLLKHLPERLRTYELGIEIKRADIKLEPPAQVKDAFESLTQAQTYMSTQKNQAETQAGKKRSEMQARINKRKNEADAYANDQRVHAVTEAANFHTRLAQYRELSRANPDYVNTLWVDEMTVLVKRMKEAERIQLLDQYLTSEGISITQFPLSKKK